MVLRRESPQILKGISRSKKKIVKSKLVYFDTRVPFIALKAYEALNSEMKSGRRIQLSEGDVVKKIQCLGNSNKRKGWTDILMFWLRQKPSVSGCLSVQHITQIMMSSSTLKSPRVF